MQLPSATWLVNFMVELERLLLGSKRVPPVKVLPRLRLVFQPVKPARVPPQLPLAITLVHSTKG